MLHFFVKFFRYFVIPFGILMLSLIILSIFLPSDYSASSSYIITKKPLEVFPVINEISTWKKWSVWNEKSDSSIVYAVSGPDEGEGAILMWYGDILGSGRLEIVRSKPDSVILFELNREDGHFVTDGEIQIIETGSGSRIIWSENTTVTGNPFLRYFAIILDNFAENDIKNNLIGLEEYLIRERSNATK